MTQHESVNHICLGTGESIRPAPYFLNFISSILQQHRTCQQRYLVVSEREQQLGQHDLVAPGVNSQYKLRACGKAINQRSYLIPKKRTLRLQKRKTAVALTERLLKNRFFNSLKFRKPRNDSLYALVRQAYTDAALGLPQIVAVSHVADAGLITPWPSQRIYCRLNWPKPIKTIRGLPASMLSEAGPQPILSADACFHRVNHSPLHDVH